MSNKNNIPDEYVLSVIEWIKNNFVENNQNFISKKNGKIYTIETVMQQWFDEYCKVNNTSIII